MLGDPLQLGVQAGHELVVAERFLERAPPLRHRVLELTEPAVGRYQSGQRGAGNTPAGGGGEVAFDGPAAEVASAAELRRWCTGSTVGILMVRTGHLFLVIRLGHHAT